MKRNDRIAKEVGNLPKEERDAYKKLYPYEMINKNDRGTYKYISHLIETSPKFMLKISDAAMMYNSYTVINDVSTTALFSKELIALCLKKLSDFINDFQLKELPNEEVIALSIDKYNRTHRQQLPKADMIQFYLLLVETGSFKEANRLSRYSHATLYRYKARGKFRIS